MLFSMRHTYIAKSGDESTMHTIFYTAESQGAPSGGNRLVCKRTNRNGNIGFKNLIALQPLVEMGCNPYGPQGPLLCQNLRRVKHAAPFSKSLQPTFLPTNFAPCCRPWKRHHGLKATSQAPPRTDAVCFVRKCCLCPKMTTVKCLLCCVPSVTSSHHRGEQQCHSFRCTPNMPYCIPCLQLWAILSV